MTIGVDAGALCVSDDRLKVGVYRVARRLLQELSTLDLENEYRLYSFHPLDDDFMQTLSPNMENIVLRPKKGWFEFRLPASLLIHPVDLFLGVSQAVPIGLQTNIGFIYDVGFLHYPHAYPQSQRSLARRTKQLVKRSEHIVTISETSKKDICHFYDVREDEVIVAYPGVDERFSPDGDVFHGSLPYFLHVGSLKPGKNIPAIIRAFSEFLKQADTEYALVIIGGNYWMDEKIFQVIHECNLEKYVRLIGYVPDDVLPQYYRGALAFVTASLTEGFCLPVMEAMACGCPVIASNTASFPEIIPEEQFLIDPENIEGYVHAMMEVVKNQELRSIAIAKGIAKSSEFSWKSFGETVYRVIQESLNNE
ncbi:MAG: glycosyltransferase family 4 protein [Patescibacteria group bacterium]|nr:glycosyltransferase family 4 protein [Patescibacteria group bacterium]